MFQFKNWRLSGYLKNTRKTYKVQEYIQMDEKNHIMQMLTERKLVQLY